MLLEKIIEEMNKQYIFEDLLSADPKVLDGYRMCFSGRTKVHPYKMNRAYGSL